MKEPTPHFAYEYCRDFDAMFGRVINGDGKLCCTRKDIQDFVDKHHQLVELVTMNRMVLYCASDGEEDPDRDLFQEFHAVFAPALVCYERIICKI